MIPDLTLLAEAGGWAVVVVGGAAVAIGVVRGWWVPGWVYRESERARKVAETQAERNTELLMKLADQWGVKEWR